MCLPCDWRLIEAAKLESFARAIAHRYPLAACFALAKAALLREQATKRRSPCAIS